jgi:hypothetical protein
MATQNLLEPFGGVSKPWANLNVESLATLDGVNISDAGITNPKQPCLRAKSAGPAQLIPDITDTVLTCWDTSVVQGDVDFANILYPAQSTLLIGPKGAGIYYLQATINFTNSAVGLRTLKILVNNVAVAIQFQSADATTGSELSTTKVVALNVGDTVKVSVIQTTGNDLDVGGNGALNSFSVVKLF